MAKKKWIFVNDDLEVEIYLSAVDFRAAQNCMEILLRNYQREEWRVVEGS